MTRNDGLGALLESLVNTVSHPRGRTLAFLAKSSLTVDQAILLNHARETPGSSPTSLAAKMNLSLPSVSQMIERLVRTGLLRRHEDQSDHRKKTIELTPKAKTLLVRFRSVRIEEFEAAIEELSATTRRKLASAITEALRELGAAQPSTT